MKWIWVGTETQQAREFQYCSVSIMVWSVEHRVFIVRQFFKNGESFVQTQRDFRTHYQIPYRGAIPGRNTILRWVTTFNRAGNVLKTKPQGRNRTMRTPENIERVRVDTLRSPNRSVRLRGTSDLEERFIVSPLENPGLPTVVTKGLPTTIEFFSANDWAHGQQWRNDFVHEWWGPFPSQRLRQQTKLSLLVPNEPWNSASRPSALP